jgi:hypothetical protein
VNIVIVGLCVMAPCGLVGHCDISQ